MFDKKESPETPNGEKHLAMLLLIKQYKDQHYPIPNPDPTDAVKNEMGDLGL